MPLAIVLLGTFCEDGGATMGLLGVWHTKLFSGQLRLKLLAIDAIVPRCKESTAFRNSLPDRSQPVNKPAPLRSVHEMGQDRRFAAVRAYDLVHRVPSALKCNTLQEIASFRFPEPLLSETRLKEFP